MGFQNVTRLLDIAVDDGYVLSGQILSIDKDHKVTGGGTYLADASQGPVVVTLPGLTTKNGTLVNVKKVDSSGNFVTVVVPDTTTIDGMDEVVLVFYGENLQVQFFRDRWYIL